MALARPNESDLPDCDAPALRQAPDSCRDDIMLELIRSNDAVLISFVESLLKEAGIGHFIADSHMSILDGSIGALPRRLMVDADEVDSARALMREAGLGHELS
jgi:hypothetical protein